MTRCRAWFWNTMACLFCYGLVGLVWLLMRVGVAPVEWRDQEPTDTKRAA